MSLQMSPNRPDVWMEIKIVLETAEYRLIRDHAYLESKSVSEFVVKLIRQFIEEDIQK